MFRFSVREPAWSPTAGRMRELRGSPLRPATRMLLTRCDSARTACRSCPITSVWVGPPAGYCGGGGLYGNWKGHSTTLPTDHGMPCNVLQRAALLLTMVASTGGFQCTMIASGALRPGVQGRLAERLPLHRLGRSAAARFRQGANSCQMVAGSSQEAISTAKAPWRDGTFWTWRGMPVRYAAINPDGKGSPLLLVHGFGASLEHWRDNAEGLAKDRPVYVIDLLGFGFSAQPAIPRTFNRWGGHVWASQIVDFISEVILPASAEKRVVVAGNSLGGYSALLACGAGSVKGGTIGGLVLVS